MNKAEQILNTAIKHSLIHKKRMLYAANKMSGFMPLNADTYANLNDEQIETIDQFIYRFTKLQDTIGKNLFRATLEYLGEFHSNLPMIDILTKLEKLQIINDIEIWNELRELRNELAHDCNDIPEIAIERINNIYDKKDNLISFLDDIVKYLETKYDLKFIIN